jgi:hypothetical protein
MAKRASKKAAAVAAATVELPAALTGEQRRSSARRRPRARTKVLDTTTRDELGRILDLSESGLRLESARALRNGVALDLLIDCSTPEDPVRHARVGVQVRWSSPGLVPGHFESGLQIKAMVKRDADALKALYARLAAAAAAD